MYVITGATGTVGRPLVEALVAAGAKVRAISRDPGAAFPSGVDMVEGDPARPMSVEAALDGATGLFVHPRAVGEAAAELVAAARERGIQRVVALAAINVDDPLDQQPSRFNGDRNKEAEDAVVASGLEWVSVRPSSFAQNVARAFGPQVRSGDVVRGPYATFAEAPIHERDIAEVIAKALLTDQLLGRRLSITGPESLTHERLVTVIGEVLGRPLRYQEVPPEVAAQGLSRVGFGPAAVSALMARYARGVGQPAPVSDGVAVALGRAPLNFASWVGEHRAAFQRDGDLRAS